MKPMVTAKDFGTIYKVLEKEAGFCPECNMPIDRVLIKDKMSCPEGIVQEGWHCNHFFRSPAQLNLKSKRGRK